MKRLDFSVLQVAAAAALVCALAASVASIDVNDHDKIVSCYVGTWAFYRPGEGKFDVEDLDPMLCTHGFYGFADLDNVTWEIYAYDPWYDLAPGDCDPGYCNYDSYRRFVALKDKNPDFKPLLSIGGWNAGSGKYSLMAADPAKRASFISSTIDLLLQFGFEGVDLDWEYPGTGIGTNNVTDMDNFSSLVDEFRTALDATGQQLLLTAALSPGYDKINFAYDVPYIFERFDFANIMCYDYHGWWPEYFTGHNAPLMGRKEENNEGHPGFGYHTYDTIEYYISLGAPVEKMVMGIPTYGRGFQIVNLEDDGLYCPTDDGIRQGPYTLQKGIWGYNEVLQAMNNDTLINLPEATPHSWKVVVDGCYKAPYMVNGPYWLGYDDPESVAWKTKYVNFREMAGAMIWSAETDDFGANDSPETYPILRSINEVLASGETYDPNQPNCETAPICDLIPITPEFPITTTEDPNAGETTSHQPGLGGECNYHNEELPYPGDCHKYYICKDPEGDGIYDVLIFTCGDFAYNPNTNSCVDPNLPATCYICGTCD